MDDITNINLTNTNDVEIDVIVEKYGKKAEDGSIQVNRCRFTETINPSSFNKIGLDIRFFECVFVKTLNIYDTPDYILNFDLCKFDKLRCEGRKQILVLHDVQIEKFECFSEDSEIRLYPDTIKELHLGGSQNKFTIIGGTFNLINISKKNFDLPCIIDIVDCNVGVIQLVGKLENEITLTGIKIKKFFISHFINKGFVWIRNLQLIEGKGNLEIHTSDLTGVRLADCELDKFKYNVKASDLSGAIFSNCGFIEYDGEGSTRDIYRQLKYSAKSNEDTVSYLYYRSKELDAYKKELKQLKKWYSNDRIILMLSKWSNFYGFRWTWAFKFILVIAIIFYAFLILTLSDWPVKFGWISVSETWNALTTVSKSFIQFLNPAHSLTIFDSYDPNPLTYILDFAGRIFIGFGIYQLIKAFRKFVL